MSFVELIPIGTLLALLTNEVLATALAAKDVLIEKESFKTLSTYLYDIEPVLKELQARGLKESPAARQALLFLKEDVIKAKDLVEKYSNRSRIYLLFKCRHIVKEVQDVTRGIGRSLETVSLASTEVLSDISEKVKILHDQMARAEFEASQSRLIIIDKLKQGLSEQNSNLKFVNDMLAEIAIDIGIPVESTEINKELESFRREKEEAAARKEQAEVMFLDQVIKLLSLADVADDQEVRKQYEMRVQAIEKYGKQEEYIPPFNTFICPIEKAVMVEPVSLCTGTTCEKRAIEAQFDGGNTKDPRTGQDLEDCSLRLNVAIKLSIKEWREWNYCLKIRSAKWKLQSDIDSLVKEALFQIQELVKENPINKDWVAIEGIVEKIVNLLSLSHNREVRKSFLVTLMVLVEGHGRNKDRVIDCGGLDQVILCLGRDTNTAKAGVDLLFELLQDGSGWNLSISTKLAQHKSAILFLVTILKGTVTESAQKSKLILLKLCDDDDNNIVRVAAAHWYKPLIDRFCRGPDQSKIMMAKALVEELELVDADKKLLGEEGIISSLVEMLFGNLESKDLGFSVLAKLSSCDANKKLIADAGGVSIVTDHMFSSHIPTKTRAKCSEILERLTSDDGIEYLVDASGNRLDLEMITTNLLAILRSNPVSNVAIRKPVLHALLGIYKSNSSPVERAVAGGNGVSIVLPLLQDSDSEIREVSLNLLYRFSQHEPDGISDFLLVHKRLDSFVSFLEDDSKIDVQIAAAGLLANLPKSEVTLTENLLQSNGLAAILNILRHGTIEAKENALGALFRFTDPSNVDMQQKVVTLGAYPLLVSFLKSSSLIVQARSAALLGNFSRNSLQLTITPVRTGCWCFRRPQVSVCVVHGGICSVTTSFCLVSANAIPDLVRLLQEKLHETTYEAVQTLGTLVPNSSSYGGANILHKNEAIHPMLKTLEWGSGELKEEVLGLLEKVFTSRDLAEQYCQTARIPLLGLSTRTHDDDQLARMAARVLAKLERYSSSMPLH